MATKYLVGIDVGSYSLGCAAIEVDDAGNPIQLLNTISFIHDSGIDPDSNKSATTRLAVSGIARRTRRLYRRRKRRTIKLEKFLCAQGWKTVPFEQYTDPYLPWTARVALVNGFIADSEQRGEYLSIALRHIANHRGWRNPYHSTSSLYSPGEPSDAFNEIREGLSKRIGHPIPCDATVGQLISFAQFGRDRLRGGGKKKDLKNPDHAKQAVISARLQQSDHAREINEICRVQKIDDGLRKKIIDLVFAAESPKGAQAGRVGKDPLQPTKYRALKASDNFQRYRVAALIGNLRIRQSDKTQRRLTAEERSLVFDHLINMPANKEPSWLDVAEILSVDRGRLRGTATITDDGERAGARPPVHETNRVIARCKVKPLTHWWTAADPDHRAEMLKALSYSAAPNFDSKPGAAVQAFFAGLEEDDHQKLDALHLPIGRAAYSEDTLSRLTAWMQSENMDLYEARRAEFGVSEDWTPPKPRIGEPVGNPAVDRVLKGLARWLEAAEAEWGAPESIVIEHVRDGFSSENVAREISRENDRRHKRNLKLYAEMQEKLNIDGAVRRSDLWRYQSLQRQNEQCAYCGSPITFSNCEMDHIVPRAGQGSTNVRENLVAVCHRCNLAKKNIPFAVWAQTCTIPGVSLREALERTKFWLPDPGQKKSDFNKFRSAVCERLKRTHSDEPLDSRSIESVAWMANEVRGRVAQHFRDSGTNVSVYRGALTAEARRASGIHKRLRFIDGPGKTRFDRRHHAVDAAIIAFTTPYVAQTLAERANKRQAAFINNAPHQWKEYTGADDAHRAAWNSWVPKVRKLALMLQQALDKDRIVVTSNLRLRLGNGRAHEDTIGALKTIRLGNEISATDIDRASSEALWCALTREPDFDPKNGLPANPDRRIRVHGSWFDADDNIKVFPVGAGCIKVRGGYAELSRFHHARIYKITGGKKPSYAMLRVYNVDLLDHRDEDLFSVEIKPQSISARQAEPKLRKALAEGTADYLGWLVVDDELVIDTSSFTTGHIGEFQTVFGPVSRWRLDGFYSESRLRLRPLLMSAEGIDPQMPDVVQKIVDRPGWLPSINVVFGTGQAKIIRRDSLGRVRLSSAAHLPVSWKVR